MSITNFFLFLGGLGAFLFGVKVLSDNMEKLANRRLKSLFQKTSKNPLVGIGVGAAVGCGVGRGSALGSGGLSASAMTASRLPSSAICLKCLPFPPTASLSSPLPQKL